MTNRTRTQLHNQAIESASELLAISGVFSEERLSNQLTATWSQ